MYLIFSTDPPPEKGKVNMIKLKIQLKTLIFVEDLDFSGNKCISLNYDSHILVQIGTIIDTGNSVQF